MDSIYDQHAHAFAGVSAYVVLDAQHKPVARVAFKWSRTSTRTWCYFHALGIPMVRGKADGGGYDKASAAAWSATRKLPEDHPLRDVIKDQGQHWDRDLQDAGFTVLQAV